MMPREVPQIFIIDPSQRKPIEKHDGPGYVFKSQGFIFNISTPGKELSALIDKFMEEKLDHHYVSDDRVQQTKVKMINTETFEKEILKNPKVTQAVIEVIKDHCPACFIAKFNTNMISRKMHHHGLIDQLPFFRMKITNNVPWLGEFPHTPIHLYIRKEGNDIVEIKLLDSPLP